MCSNAVSIFKTMPVLKMRKYHLFGLGRTYKEYFRGWIWLNHRLHALEPMGLCGWMVMYVLQFIQCMNNLSAVECRICQSVIDSLQSINL